MNMPLLIGIMAGVIVIILVVIIVFMLKGMSTRVLEKNIEKMSNQKGMETSVLEDTLVNMSEAVVRAQNKIIKNNEEMLKDTADRSAKINRDAIKSKASAVKEGFEDNNTTFCKYCGASIDSDSVFCKECGKKLK